MTELSDIKACVLDFDGLILDTESTGFQAWQELFESHGQKYRIEDFQKIVGTSNSAADPRAILESLTGRSLNWSELDPRRAAREQTLADQLPVKSGILELLDQAKALGLRLAVASSSPHHWVDAHLARVGLFECFEAVVCSEDVAHVKPAPDLYIEAVRRLGVRAGQAVAFEDSHNGSLAAKRAGLRCVVIPNEITRSQDFSHADLVVPTLAGFRLSE